MGGPSRPRETSQSRPYLAVLFDLDGTLTLVPSFWQHLHEALEQWHGNAEDYQRQFLSGAIDYATFCRLDALHWKGRRVGELRKIADAVALRPGAREIRDILRERGLKVGVVSTGLTLLAQRVHRELELDFTIANRLVTRRGRITGEVKINVEHDHKEEAVELFCNQFGIPPDRVIAVGDSQGDVSMFRAVGFSVALNPRDEEVTRAASAVCRAHHLLELLLHLPLGPGGGEGIH
jgi:phosphoserine phosphatase